MTTTTNRKAEFIAIDRLWKLLEFALQDYKACEVAPNVKFNMGVWLDQYEDGICYVCLAGSVLLNTFEVKSPTDKFGNSLEKVVELASNSNKERKLIENRCNAINELRSGLICSAYVSLYDTIFPDELRTNVKLTEAVDDIFYDGGDFNYDLLKQLASVLKELDV